MTKFIVFGIQRSGTTLLVHLIDSHPQIFCAGEVFKINSSKIHHSEYLYRHFIERPRIPMLNIFSSKKSKTIQFLNFFYKKNRSFNAAGFKLMLDQLFKYPDILKYVQNQKVKILLVERANTLKQYLSLQMAIKTKRWASTKKVPQEKIYVNCESIISALDKLNQDKEKLEKLIEKHDYLKIVYERLLSDNDGTLKKALNFLNVNEDATLSTSLVKINSDNMQKIVRNYEELYLKLKDTPYEQLISQ